EEHMPFVEQVKAKRFGTGLRALDVERACPGFTLFAPQSGGGNVYLIDLGGNVTHTWQMPYPPVTPVISLKEELSSTTERPTRTRNASSAGNLGRAALRLRSTGMVVCCGKSDNPIITMTA